MTTSNHSLVLPALLLSVSIGVSGWLLSEALFEVGKPQRAVTVKGLVEKDVKSDFAVWAMRFRVADNDLNLAQSAIMTQRDTMLKFLKGQGLKDEEIDIGNLRVIDKQAQEYGDSQGAVNRFIIEMTVTVRSANVEVVSKAAANSADLVKQGIVLSQDNSCDGGVRFVYTKLNEIKPQMLAEATKNARKAAEQFANDSGSKVGVILKAYQGVFSINSRDRVAENMDGGGGCSETASVFKKVRVVTTVDYALED